MTSADEDDTHGDSMSENCNHKHWKGDNYYQHCVKCGGDSSVPVDSNPELVR